MSAKPSRRIGWLRIFLTIVAVAGFASSIYYNQKLFKLRQIRADLQKQVGLLEVEDASQVVITHVPVSEETIPPGVNKAYVWQYRIHIPANYAPSYQSINGMVTADSPQGRGGSGSNTSSPNPEPQEALGSVALVQNQDSWMLCHTSMTGSSSLNMPDGFSFETLDEVVVEPVVQEGETRTFNVDEAICLFRLREKNPATTGDGENEKQLYRGVVLYLLSQEQQAAFAAWASGNASSMEETQK